MQHTYDLGIAWGDPVHAPFADAVSKAAKAAGLTFLEVTYNNLPDMFTAALDGKLACKTFIDRGGIDHPGFFGVALALYERGTRVLNDPRALLHASSKTTLIDLFKKEGLPVQRTVIIPGTSRDQKQAGVANTRDLNAIIKEVGIPFTIKPAYGGYADEVMLNAYTSADIENYINEDSTEDVLVQEFVVPGTSGRRMAWFRILYAAGLVEPFWWNPQNHFYEPLENETLKADVVPMVERIADITKLDLFSTEIAIDHKGDYVIIDYANHPMDLNAQDLANNCVPRDAIVRIAENLVLKTKETI